MIKNLVKIQNEIRAPKNQLNTFGNYKFRSCESILQAAKPVLEKYNCQLTLSDEVVAVGSRIYFKATAKLTDADGNTEVVTAYAQEAESKKGMDPSQLSGCASSYSRKYAISGLFLLDDNKDADSNEYQGRGDSDRITPKEIEALKVACRRSGKSFVGAVKAVGCLAPEEVTKEQYRMLMAQLSEVA